MQNFRKFMHAIFPKETNRFMEKSNSAFANGVRLVQVNLFRLLYHDSERDHARNS